MRLAVQAIMVGTVAWLPFFGYQLALTPYRLFEDEHARSKTLQSENTNLRVDLTRKRQSLDSSDPAFHNMLDTIRAFMGYRRALGDGAPCQILITATPDSASPASAITAFAVVGANCPNGDLQNIGIEPQDVERVAAYGLTPGKVILHALPHAKGVDALVDSLRNLFQIQRSYKMPETTKTIPDGTIWLQFGPGAECTELFASRSSP
jgi:hypothetical protein